MLPLDLAGEVPGERARRRMLEEQDGRQDQVELARHALEQLDRSQRVEAEPAQLVVGAERLAARADLLPHHALEESHQLVDACRRAGGGGGGRAGGGGRGPLRLDGRGGLLLHHRSGDGARVAHVAVDQLEVEEAPRVEGVLAALHRGGAAIEAGLHRGGRDVREIPPAVHRVHRREATAEPGRVLAQAAEQLLVGHPFFQVGPEQVHVGVGMPVVEGHRVPDAARILAVVLHQEEAIARQALGGDDHRRVVEEADLREELGLFGRQLEPVRELVERRGDHEAIESVGHAAHAHAHAVGGALDGLDLRAAAHVGQLVGHPLPDVAEPAPGRPVAEGARVHAEGGRLGVLEEIERRQLGIGGVAVARGGVADGRGGDELLDPFAGRPRRQRRREARLVALEPGIEDALEVRPDLPVVAQELRVYVGKGGPRRVGLDVVEDHARDVVALDAELLEQRRELLVGRAAQVPAEIEDVAADLDRCCLAADLVGALEDGHRRARRGELARRRRARRRRRR